MLLRSTSTSALLLLAACQGAPHNVDSHAINANAVDSHGDWRSRIEYSQAEVMREVAGVRELLAARAMGATKLESSDVGGSVASLDALEWVAKISELDGRVNQLQAALRATDGAGTVDASHSVGGAPTNTPPAATGESPTRGAIDALRESLRVLAREHALHCENIANSNIPGYKRRTLTLSTSVTDANGLRIPSIRGSRFMMLQGVLELTGNELDFGVEGRGFFEVALPNGSSRYTRNGIFRQDFNGRIVTPEGYLLTDQVTIPRGSQGISISNDGQVFSLEEGNNLTAIGTIRLHCFSNPASLRLAGPHSFEATVSSGQAMARQPGVEGAGSIKQGYIERSNVDFTEELIDLQLVERQAAAVRRTLATHGIYAR